MICWLVDTRLLGIANRAGKWEEGVGFVEFMLFVDVD